MGGGEESRSVSSLIRRFVLTLPPKQSEGMKRTSIWLFGCLLTAACSLTHRDAEEGGVSQSLAEQRSGTVSGVHYDLFFRLPAAPEASVEGAEDIHFRWEGGQDLLLDFNGEAAGIQALWVNGESVAADFRNEHLALPACRLKSGENVVTIRFTAADRALNRHEDYLYTLFVPDNARSAFPCFDQPDLKATYSLRLTLPRDWEVISQTPFMPDEASAEEGYKTVTCRTERPVPTYLVSFTAGRFQRVMAERDGRPLELFHRETDAQKTAQLETVFDEIALALRWMEDYTGIPFPFEKYGCVVLPGYQFGGMEHPGAIQFNANTIFLGPSPTPDEELARLNLIAHETAHMWFGDMVTMQWFDDVWTKEVFANLLADKIAREKFPDLNHNLMFIKSHYPAAMHTDRTLGANPIQQPLANLNQASLLYGNIIYHKAPVMMRKLEEHMGNEAFRRGLQAYLKRYAYANATWDGLIEMLDSVAPQADLPMFSRVWVKEAGLPVIRWEGRGDSLRVMQTDPLGRGLSWPQTLTFANPRQPDVVLPNYDGLGYGRFLFDDIPSLQEYAEKHLELLESEESRLAWLMNLYENYLEGNIPADNLAWSVFWRMGWMQNPLVLSYAADCLAAVLPYVSSRSGFEEMILMSSQQHEQQATRQRLTRLLGTKARSEKVVKEMYRLWKEQADSTLSERDYMRMAYHLALVCPEEWEEILDCQRQRLSNDDLLREFDFVSRGCNPDTLVQLQLFDDLLVPENRTSEPWARDLLALLCDESREPQCLRYLRPGLNALPQIQRTSGIFFPGYWLSALLGSLRSEKACQIVNEWIDSHSDIHAPLLNKVKEQAFYLGVGKRN